MTAESNPGVDETPDKTLHPNRALAMAILASVSVGLAVLEVIAPDQAAVVFSAALYVLARVAVVALSLAACGSWIMATMSVAEGDKDAIYWLVIAAMLTAIAPLAWHAWVLDPW
jgi:hypothetical protein